MISRIQWTKELVIERLDKFVAVHNRPPQTYDFNSLNNLPNYRSFKKIMDCTPMMYCKSRYVDLNDCTQTDSIDQNAVQETLTEDQEPEDEDFETEEYGMILSM